MTLFSRSLALVSLLAISLSAAPLLGAPAADRQAPPGAPQAALAYARALVDGDLVASWQLLSSPSRAAIGVDEWRAAFGQAPPSRPPTGTALLRAIAAADPPPTVVDVLVQNGEALVQVGATINITQQIVLVKEAGNWLVDVAASDAANSREAASLFLEAVNAEAGVPTPARPTRTRPSSLPLLRAVLTPEAKDYRVLEADVKGDQATVTLVCDLPVSVVLRAVRMGPGWMVDLSRPVANTSPISPDPLRDAVDAARRTACEDTLRQLGNAFQMYAAASDDLFPDPDEWVERLRRHLPETFTFRCPSDPTPGVSYAMNRNLAGKRRREVANASTTPLLYESALHTRNPVDTGESWPAPSFHPAGVLVLFADGSVRAVRSRPSFGVTVREAPPGTAAPAAGAPSRPRQTAPARPRR